MGLDPGRPGSLLTRASQNPPSRYCLEIRNGSRIGATKRPRGVKEVPIGCLLAPKKSARDTFCYFPNSFLETVWKSGRGRSMTYAPEHGQVLFDRSIRCRVGVFAAPHPGSQQARTTKDSRHPRGP